MPLKHLLVAQHRAVYRPLDPVLSRWGRKLHALVCIPVTFQSPLDHVPFMIVSMLVLFYAMVPGNHDNSFYGTVLFFLKYAFAMLLVSWFCLLALTRQRMNSSPLFPLAALVLAMAGVLSFIYSIAVQPGTTTYSSALIPLMLAAIPLVVPTRATQTDGAAVAGYLFRIISVAAVFHVLWFVVDYASGLEEGDPGSYTDQAFAYEPVCLMILSGLFRRKILLALSIGLTILNLVLRPSSTTGFIMLFATVVILLYRPRYRPVFRMVCVSIVGMIILANLAVFFSKDMAQKLYSIEPLMKEDVLKSDSNNAFRLGIISAARDQMIEQSILVGKLFTGDVDVDPRNYIPWWGSGQAPIHSDYVIMLQQGGLIGYGFFSILFFGAALFWARAARFAHAAGNTASEILFDAIQAINITYMLCIAGNPMLGLLHYVILLPLTVFLARDQPGFVGRRHRSTVLYPRPPNIHGISQA